MLLHDKLNSYKVVLASQSPRRKALLRELGIRFETRLIDDLDESFPDSLCGPDIPLYLAKHKASAYRDNLATNELLITADTVVLLDEHVLNKPSGADEAIEMLTRLSGRKHQVATGVCLTTHNKQQAFVDVADVYFNPLTTEEIQYYVSTFKPFDKAGAYGVQEWIGYVGIQRVEGSYFNVMGLPVHRLYAELNAFV